MKKVLFSVLAIGAFGILFSFNNLSADKGYEIDPNPNFKNLKVLPKDISDDDLKGVMRSFNDALGVKCGFCHAQGSDGKMDFASDANPKKDVARYMMNMTREINKNYFEVENPAEYAVKCATCHGGNTSPSAQVQPNEGKKEESFNTSAAK